MIKIDVIMLSIWVVAAGVLSTVDVWLTTWQYWVVMGCLLAAELRSANVAKRVEK